MPTSQAGQISKIVKIISLVKPNSVLDIGVGFGKYGFLAREYLELWDGREDYHNFQRRIDGIEVFADYLTPVHQYLYNNIYHGNAFDIIPGLNQNYDLTLLIDVLEHFDKDQGTELVRLILEKSKLLLISTPKFLIEQGSAFNNQFETHRSLWKKRDLKKMGNSCFIFDKESYLTLLGGKVPVASFRKKYFTTSFKSAALIFPYTVPVYKFIRKIFRNNN